KLKRELSESDIATAPEAYIVSLIETSMSVEAILEVSPMREEQTLRFLARLITSGLVTWADAGAQAGGRQGEGARRRVVRGRVAAAEYAARFASGGHREWSSWEALR